MSNSYQTWFRCPVSRSRPRLRLFCFPHAGGAASFFRTWPGRFPDDVEIVAVQYPGREDRFRDPCIAEMDVLVADICQAMAPILHQPIALFGHSMGAMIAYEVARRLAQRDIAVAQLFVSCHPAPHCQRDRSVHLRADDGLLEEVRRLGGTSEAMLANEELRALMLVPLRNDYRLLETHQPRPLPKLDNPVVAYLGDADPEVSSAETQAWADVTSGDFAVRAFSGDHFYLVPQQAQLTEDILQRLGNVLATSG